jgi:hypothetical protein
LLYRMLPRQVADKLKVHAFFTLNLADIWHFY